LHFLDCDDAGANGARCYDGGAYGALPFFLRRIRGAQRDDVSAPMRGRRAGGAAELD